MDKRDILKNVYDDFFGIGEKKKEEEKLNQKIIERLEEETPRIVMPKEKENINSIDKDSILKKSFEKIDKLYIDDKSKADLEYETYQDVINERVHDKRFKRKTPPFMRPKLRSAYLSLKRNMPRLWTFYDHPELGLPNTNNSLEGIFTDIKTKLRVHSGIKRDFRRKIIDEYLKRHY